MTRLRIVAFVFASFVSLVPIARAQICTWSTTDTFFPAASLRTGGAAAFINGNSVVTVGTNWSDPSTSSWVVRRSQNGNAFSTFDTFSAGPGISAHPDSITRGVLGFVVAGGTNQLGSNAGPWVTRARPLLTWKTVDTFSDPLLPAASAHATLMTLDGAVLVGGVEAQSPGGYHWVVRTSTDGTNWTIDDDDVALVATTGVNALAQNIVSADVFAAGYDFDGSQYLWKVRRRGGAAWSTVDEFSLAPSPAASSVGSVATGVAVGRFGAVFASGYARDASGNSHWLVRRSNDAGATWSNIDDVAPVGQQCAARGMAYHRASRTLLVSGRCHDGTSYHWVTRSSLDEGTTWQVEDDFVLSAGRDSFANGVATGTNARMVVVGTARGSDNVQRFVTRERNCP